MTERQEGTPRGGPVSPLLANVLLGEVDKELEKRRHAFVRHADDCSLYVRSKRAGERVMTAMRSLFSTLRLRALTRRSRGRSVPTVAAELRSYLLGCKQYFHLADTPGLFRDLDAWIRHRLRALQLKHWTLPAFGWAPTDQ